MEDRFDLVLSCGALHHLTELEDLLDKVHGLLQPDGHFVVMEFVGPNRFQWTARQCALINGLLAQLDPRYLRGGVRETFGPPTIDEMLRIDPSEAVTPARVREIHEELLAKLHAERGDRFWMLDVVEAGEPVRA